MTLDPRWTPFVREPARSALLADFDGSLAPIVDDPATAAPLPAAVAALSALASRLALVGVVTGRPVEVVRRHLVDPGVAVVGQYGLERDAGGEIVLDPRAARATALVAAAARDAEARWPALLVERKGRVAVTLHWRTVPEHAPAPEELIDLAHRHGLAALPGRMSCELRPRVAVDKGTALFGLLAGRDLVAAAFAGDDHGDLAAYRALAQWSREYDGRTSLRIAVASEESPRELLDSADLVLDGPEALAAQLVALARACGGSA